MVHETVARKNDKETIKMDLLSKGYSEQEVEDFLESAGLLKEPTEEQKKHEVTTEEQEQEEITKEGKAKQENKKVEVEKEEVSKEERYLEKARKIVERLAGLYRLSFSECIDALSKRWTSKYCGAVATSFFYDNIRSVCDVESQLYQISKKLGVSYDELLSQLKE